MSADKRRHRCGLDDDAWLLPRRRDETPGLAIACNVVARMNAAYSPAALKGNAAPLVLAALRELFPCVGLVASPRGKPDSKVTKGAAKKKTVKSHVGTHSVKQAGKKAGKQADRRKG